MIIVVDTNIVFGGWMLKSPEAQAFLDFVKKTESTILIPKIVWAEIRKNYKEAFLSKQAAYAESARYFSSVLVDKVEFIRIEPDINEQADNYLAWLNDKLRLNGKDGIVAYSEDTLDKVAARALEHRRPFNSTNQREFKDSLVWQSVLDILEKRTYPSHEEVALISNDTNAFATDKQNSALHPDMQTEINDILPKSFASNFYYYTDLKAFLNTHNTLIADITLDSISAYLNSEESGFVPIFSSIINNTMDYMTEYIRQDFIELVFPSLEQDIQNGVYKGLQEGGEFFIYQYQTGREITIFCTKTAIISADIHYAAADRADFTEHTQRDLNFYFNASIAYKDGKYGAVTIDNVSLSEVDEFEFKNPFHIRSLYIKKLEKAFFEMRNSDDADSPRSLSDIRSKAMSNQSLMREFIEMQRKISNSLPPAKKAKGPARKKKKRKRW